MRARIGWLRSVGVRLAAATLALAPAGTRAQERPRAVVVESVVGGDAQALASAMQRVVRNRIEALEVARLEATPALGFGDLGLAVGCVGRTPECLERIAAQLDVDTLVWLELERTGGVVSLALNAYTRGTDTPLQAERSFRGEDADAEALDEADALVRQLFDLPAPAPEPPEPLGDRRPTEPAPSPARPSPDEGDDALEIGLTVGLLGTGALTLAAGLVVGAVAQSSRDQYASLEVGTSADVDEALALQERAEAEATAANVLYVAGGALLVGGVTALILSLALGSEGDEEAQALSVGPLLGPGAAGIYASGRLGGER